MIDRENKAQYRPVEIGPLVDGLRVIRKGVAAEDWVVVAGLQRARPGITVDAQREAISLPIGTPQAAVKQP